MSVRLIDVTKITAEHMAILEIPVYSELRYAYRSCRTAQSFLDDLTEKCVFDEELHRGIDASSEYSLL